jgi:hypothetical protein
VPAFALSAYETGEVLGGLLPLAIGVALIVVGVRRRRAGRTSAPGWTHPVSGATDSGAAASWAPAADEVGSAGAPDDLGAAPGADWPSAAPAPWPAPAAAAPRGGGLVAGGTALVALTLVGAAGAAVRHHDQQRRVDLPSSVLALARDQSASDEAGKQVLQGIPAGLVDPQAAVYGTLPDALLVIAARTGSSDAGRQLDGFRTGIEKSGGKLTNGRDVATGSLGGAARCWEAVISSVRPDVCAFADAGSLVATIDFLGGGIDAAATRGLQVREASVHRR